MIGAAMGMTALETLRHAGTVVRYHNEPAHIQQNNAEHTWHVMSLILMLEPDPSVRLLVHAHYHDLGEIFTGDFPAPLKWEYPELKPILAKAEARRLAAIGVTLPTLTAHEQALLKFCDGAELCLTSYEAVKRGNRLAMRPFGFVLPRLQAMINEHESLVNGKVLDFLATLEGYYRECK